MGEISAFTGATLASDSDSRVVAPSARNIATAARPGPSLTVTGGGRHLVLRAPDFDGAARRLVAAVRRVAQMGAAELEACLASVDPHARAGAAAGEIAAWVEELRVSEAGAGTPRSTLRAEQGRQLFCEAFGFFPDHRANVRSSKHGPAWERPSLAPVGASF